MRSRVGTLPTFITVALVAACVGVTPPGSSNPPGSSPTVTGLSISGPSTFYTIGETETFVGTGMLSDGGTRPATLGTWQSTDPAVATVSAGGVVTAAGAGTAQIAFSSSGLMATTSVQVKPAQWTRRPGPPGDLAFQHLAIDPRNDATMYAGTTQGLYATHDAGASWTRTGTGFVSAIAIDPLNPDRIYAITGAHALLRSDDGGHEFATIQTSDDILVSLLANAHRAGTLYVGFGGYQDPNPSGVLASTDAGHTWTRRAFGVSGALIPWDIGEDSVTDTLYVGTEIADHPQPYHPQFFKSPDEGATWEDATGILPWHVIQTAVNSHDHAVLALTEGAGLFLSTDGARSWTRLSNPFGLSLAQDRLQATRVFGGAVVFNSLTGGAFISDDGGNRFVPFGLNGMTVSDLRLNGSSTSLFAACLGNGSYVTSIDAPPR